MTPRPDTPAPPAGRLVADHFRKGPRYFAYREKGSSDWLLTYTVRGSGRYRFPGGQMQTAPGDFVLVAPHIGHDYRTAPEPGHWELLWVHFLPRPEWPPLLRWPEVTSGIRRLALPARQRPSAIRLMGGVVARGAGPGRHAQLLAMNQLEELLIACDEANPASSPVPLDPRLRRAAERIHADLAEALPLRALAQVASLSPSQFTRLFHAAFGESPTRYRELQRLSRAAELLRVTQEPIGVISEQVGFHNPFYFSRRFAQYYGRSPRAWRRHPVSPHSADGDETWLLKANPVKRT